MEIIRAEKMGFCFGVQEAVNLVDEVIGKHKGKDIYILGMLVHNGVVIDELKSKNVRVLEEEEINNLKDGDVVIVRAHGTTKNIYSELYKKKLTLYDASCIFVKKARELLENMEEQGYSIILIGDKKHPEVKGIISYGNQVTVFANYDEFFEKRKKISRKSFILAQTTLNKNEYKKIKEYIKNNLPYCRVGDTICGATHERQIAVEKLAGNVDTLIVVGGRNSSNTKKLFNISKALNKDTYYIESAEEIKEEWLNKKIKIGITAGASTPEKSVEEVEKRIREEIWHGKHGKL